MHKALKPFVKAAGVFAGAPIAAGETVEVCSPAVVKKPCCLNALLVPVLVPSCLDFGETPRPCLSPST